MPASHFPATGTSQSPPAPLPPDLIKQRGNSFTVAQYQRNWTLTGLVQSLRPERRKKTLEGLPLGGGRARRGHRHLRN